MDEVESVVASVRDVVEVGRAKDWFDVVCGAFDASRGDWAALKESLAAGARGKSFSSDVAETFTRFVDGRVTDPMAVLREVCARRNDLPRWYGELIAPTNQGTAADAVAEWDNATAAQWYAHLTTSNSWAGWAGGGDAEWAEFTQWFVYFAEQQQVLPQAELLLRRVADDSGGFTAGFASLGIATNAPAVAPAVAPVTKAGWGERTATRYVELTTGKGWAGWTGADADWDLFTQWFLYYAGQDGDHQDAQLFIDMVANSPDRSKAFADHGITISAPQAEVPSQAEVQPEPEPVAVAYSPVSDEQLEELGISEADLAAAASQIDALLAGVGDVD
jgi:hypothetical protein